jgi:hypothetical protein
MFLAKSLLAMSGAVILAFTFVDMFEGTLSITELSVLELLFSALLCVFAYRHCKSSILLGLKWHRILYLPFRNCGCLVLLAFTALIFSLQQGNSIEQLNTEVLAESIMDQLFGFGLILFCIYIATPRVPSDQRSLVLKSEEKTS